MVRGWRARAAAGAAGLIALAGIWTALPALADCNGALDPLNGTPAENPVCGSPSPSPSPTGSPTPSPSPSPTQSPTGQPSPPPTFPPFTFPSVPSGIPTFTPPGFSESDQLRALQEQLAQLQAQQASQLFGGRIATSPGLAAAPSDGDGGFLARAATLLLIGTAVGMWTWRARVRRWMIGG